MSVSLFLTIIRFICLFFTRGQSLLTNWLQYGGVKLLSYRIGNQLFTIQVFAYLTTIPVACVSFVPSDKLVAVPFFQYFAKTPSYPTT